MLIETNSNVLLTQLIQLTKDYPEISTPDNIWIIGITQELSTRVYYLVFYNDMKAILNRIMRIMNDMPYKTMFIQYDDFYEIKEIGSGGYGTVYTAKHKIDKGLIQYDEQVALKKFKNIDKNAELFISEVSIHT